MQQGMRHLHEQFMGVWLTAPLIPKRMLCVGISARCLAVHAPFFMPFFGCLETLAAPVPDCKHVFLLIALGRLELVAKGKSRVFHPIRHGFVERVIVQPVLFDR